MHIVTTGGHTLQAGRKSMISDQNAKKIALWIGGLEDIQRSRYVKDVGHKGEVFEVTREGYDAAEAMDQTSGWVYRLKPFEPCFGCFEIADVAT